MNTLFEKGKAFGFEENKQFYHTYKQLFQVYKDMFYLTAHFSLILHSHNYEKDDTELQNLLEDITFTKSREMRKNVRTQTTEIEIWAKHMYKQLLN
jgi:hypothetical protein